VTDPKVFFEGWVACTFTADTPWTDLYPTPLAALIELRAAATLAGITEDELEAAVGDTVAALTAAMLDAPVPDATRRRMVPDEAGARDPVFAMELALSYGEGLQAAVGTDRRLAAHLIMHYLARQGYGLRALDQDALERPDAHVPPADVEAAEHLH
jgi:hypothetical protein